jgi:hypothetical protein
MNDTPTPSQNEVPESELLVPFEIQNIPAEYREYYKIKRNNFFASIQNFSDIWKCYMLLDKIWLREFDDLKPARDPERMFPMLLYINAHAKIRVSMELAFTGCLAEARSILRDGIEFVAHAHCTLADPELQKVWLSKNQEAQAFKDAFERHKREGVFKGLEELHRVWGHLSETGSHATVNSICDRFQQVESEDTINFNVIYCGAEPRMWAMQLFWMLLACFKMEETMFIDYRSRLQLDDVLMRTRGEFERCKESLRRSLAIRYKVTPPEPTSPIWTPKT